MQWLFLIIITAIAYCVVKERGNSNAHFYYLSYRDVTCHQGSNGKELEDDYCLEETRPEEVSNCTMDACPGWSTSNWSSVSVP